MDRLRKLLIYPFNGNGLEALDCLGDRYDLIGFIDDTPEKQGPTLYGLEVFPRHVLDKYPEALVLAVPGSPISYLSRKDIIGGLKIKPERWATVIHPKASISPIAKIGVNCLILAGTVLTSNVVMGDHVCMLANSVLHHDVLVDDYAIIGSNVTISGRTRLGANCYIASGSSVLNGIMIGDCAMVGMASNVLQSVPPNSTVVGNPARLLRS